MAQEIEANFPGGLKAWKTYLKVNINKDIPNINDAPPGEYMIQIEFFIEADGTTGRFKAITKYGYGMEDELIRVIKNCPKWEPASLNNINKPSLRRQTITFTIP